MYHHFGSKLGLLGAVAANYGNGIAQVMAQQQDLSQPPQVDRMIRAVFDYVEEHGLLHELLLAPDGPGDWKAVMHAHREVIVGYLAAAFKLWQSKGYIHTTNTDIAAALMFGLVESALTECFARGQAHLREQFLEETVRCIEQSLAPQEPPAESG